ncbi:deoxyguanosinetriphosphate triphosphohydrolase [Defluviitalea phaphyphila]|uniref:deoxyguanosinetriphosphate triphosphohydrolase n=1 Tax=Defluviitalea phaphyphila TaxID=1473580 RepID=UPI000730433B|nr:deoxyguanosinetriphosphate triphosphohydrolase [Defluviitalea phaphyphila]
MNLREIQEKREEEFLSPYAVKSKNSRGRKIEEKKCDVRTDFQRDRDRIIHCKTFRRLKHKTQVFISPEGDHYRTRLTHTLEVSQIARTIARALSLNEDLTEAIALGHDLGHTPFGHAGEQVLNEISPLGFKHYEQSLRVVDILERNGRGLNLTWEVRDGIINHPTKGTPSTLEGKIVQLSDKIAYINHDIDDAIRGKIIKEEDLPKDCIEILGDNFSKRINTMIRDIIKNSIGKPDIIMSKEVERSMKKLRKFMFEHVYIGSLAKKEEKKAQHIVKQLYKFFVKHPEKIPKEFYSIYEEENKTKERIVCDYIAGMTDRYAIKKYCEIYVPSSWNIY